MKRTLLKEIILEQQKEIKKKDGGIERIKLSQVKKYFKLPHTVIIAGIRRTGKSTLLFQIMDKFYKNNCYYFNFEDERLLNFQVEDFNALYELFIEIKGKKKNFFFDEIQNIKGWENFVRRMQDQGNKFFITGSNASLLSKELGTKLTGRYVYLELLPFSFKEYLSFKNISFNENSFFQTAERAKLKRNFSSYLKEGGMPEYLKYQEKEVLARTYEDILYRDIAMRYDLKQVKALRELALYFLSNLACLFSYNSLKKFLKLGSVNTVKNYVEYLENSFLIFTVNLFSYSLKQQFVAPKKVYCIDNGLSNSISFRFSRDKGKFLENLVFLELKRREEEIYYYKTKNNLEVDFLIREERKVKKLIQVTKSLDDFKTREREMKSLITAMKELKMKNGLILTEDEEDLIKDGNLKITVLPIWKWLLE
ncbi:MAG: ATP-binding protein [Candidatus Pacebacteria bacterium]|nr:ATP-binding protein [Candidatus Paceibacterota bacterium]